MVRIVGTCQLSINFPWCRKITDSTCAKALKIKFEVLQQQLRKITLKISVTKAVLNYVAI